MITSIFSSIQTYRIDRLFISNHLSDAVESFDLFFLPVIGVVKNFDNLFFFDLLESVIPSGLLGAAMLYELLVDESGNVAFDGFGGDAGGGRDARD